MFFFSPDLQRGTTHNFVSAFLADEPFPKWGLLCKSFSLRVDPSSKGGTKETERVASLESIPIHPHLVLFV